MGHGEVPNPIHPLIAFFATPAAFEVEACALDVDAVNWRDQTVAVEAIYIRVKGRGMWRVTPLPASTIAMLARRRLTRSGSTGAQSQTRFAA